MNIAKYGAAMGSAKRKAVNLSPLRFTNTGNEEATISFSKLSSMPTQLQYRTTEDGDFTSWDFSALTIPVGGFVEIVGENPTMPESVAGIGRFIMTGGDISASGNIMTLLYGSDITEEESLVIPYNNPFRESYSEFGLYGLFYICDNLVAAPELPATKLTQGCYWGMFFGCSHLRTVPELPATELADDCYGYMFKSCIDIPVAPQLPALQLSHGCYKGMFMDCASLHAAPELPATKLAEECYYQMFYNSAVKDLPKELPATTLSQGCYYQMFYSCENIIEAPTLPAQSLVKNCYYQMFYECSSLALIKCLATDIPTDVVTTTGWVYHVSSNGIFIKAQEMDSWETGQYVVNGIPYGWTVENA